MNERFKNIKSISDIVDTMIRGLRKEWVQVRMYSFGEADGKLCFGCAATNTLCEIMQEPFSTESIWSLENRAKKFNFDITNQQLHDFEAAIDSLRCGSIKTFRGFLLNTERMLPFSVPDLYHIVPPFDLPVMKTRDWEALLPEYEKYRDWLRAKGL